jgi:hypothetical protein
VVDLQEAGPGGDEHRGSDGKGAAAYQEVACEATEEFEATLDSKVVGCTPHQQVMLSIATTVDAAKPSELFLKPLLSPGWHYQEEGASEECGE